MCLYVNVFIYICVCVCLLILLLNCFCTEQVLKNTTRQSDRQPESDIVVACCACEWNRQRLTLITVIPCVCVNICTFIFKYTYIHTYGMHVCNLSLLCGCFLYLCNCSLLSFSPIYCNCVVARSRVEKAVSLLIIHMYVCMWTDTCVCAYLCGNECNNV